MNASECMDSGAPCVYHRYGVVHCLSDSQDVISHSQGDWDSRLRTAENVETYNARYYEHGMTADELRAAACLGLKGPEEASK